MQSIAIFILSVCPFSLGFRLDERRVSPDAISKTRARLTSAVGVNYRMDTPPK